MLVCRVSTLSRWIKHVEAVRFTGLSRGYCDFIVVQLQTLGDDFLR